MKSSLVSFWGGLTALLFLAACSAKSDRPDAAGQFAQSAVAVDSSNFLPVFEDNGYLDSLFTAQGYVFGDDILAASKAGNMDASFILAQMYAYGICGAQPDRNKAFALYRVLADSGMPQAQAIAGYMLFYGIGPVEDTEEGVRLWVASANQNCGIGCLYLANFYANNAPNTQENKNNARLCFAKAAALGMPGAQELLDDYISR